VIDSGGQERGLGEVLLVKGNNISAVVFQGDILSTQREKAKEVAYREKKE
jgi:hypothetical protein